MNTERWVRLIYSMTLWVNAGILTLRWERQDWLWVAWCILGILWSTFFLTKGD